MENHTVTGMAQNDARGHQKRSNRAPGSPKVRPRAPTVRPRAPKVIQKWAKGCQKVANWSPKGAKSEPNSILNRHKRQGCEKYWFLGAPGIPFSILGNHFGNHFPFKNNEQLCETLYRKNYETLWKFDAKMKLHFGIFQEMCSWKKHVFRKAANAADPIKPTFFWWFYGLP